MVQTEQCRGLGHSTQSMATDSTIFKSICGIFSLEPSRQMHLKSFVICLQEEVPTAHLKTFIKSSMHQFDFWLNASVDLLCSWKLELWSGKSGSSESSESSFKHYVLQHLLNIICFVTGKQTVSGCQATLDSFFHKIRLCHWTKCNFLTIVFMCSLYESVGLSAL